MPARQFGRLPDGLIATRLAYLMDNAHPADRGPYLLDKVAVMTQRTAYPLMASYVRQLRLGTTINPTVGTLHALAEVFEVPVTYFFGGRSDGHPSFEDDLALARALTPTGSDASVRRSALGSSPAGKEALAAVIALLQELDEAHGVAGSLRRSNHRSSTSSCSWLDLDGFLRPSLSRPHEKSSRRDSDRSPRVEPREGHGRQYVVPVDSRASPNPSHRPAGGNHALRTLSLALNSTVSHRVPGWPEASSRKLRRFAVLATRARTPPGRGRRTGRRRRCCRRGTWVRPLLLGSPRLA